MKSRILNKLIAPLLVISLVLAGCGSDGSTNIEDNQFQNFVNGFDGGGPGGGNVNLSSVRSVFSNLNNLRDQAFPYERYEWGRLEWDECFFDLLDCIDVDFDHRVIGKVLSASTSEYFTTTSEGQTNTDNMTQITEASIQTTILDTYIPDNGAVQTIQQGPLTEFIHPSTGYSGTYYYVQHFNGNVYVISEDIPIGMNPIYVATGWNGFTFNNVELLKCLFYGDSGDCF